MANLLFAPENLTRSGLETPEGVSLHAGWYKSAPQQSLWTAWTSLARPTPPTGQQQHQSGHLMCYEGRTSSRALDRLSTGRVGSSSHSSRSFQIRTPLTRIGARPLGPSRGGRSSSSRQATQTTASPVLVRMLDAPMARAARSAVSEPPP